MPQPVPEYRCLLISPGDVIDERDALTNMMNSWNAQIGKALNVRVELVRWELHGTPDMSAPAQAVLNKQLLDTCELAIALFWYRIGTATQDYESGSVEEIDLLLKRGVRVLIYFCERPIPQAALVDDQFHRLGKFREHYESKGLVSKYTDVQDLREQVNLHVTNIVVGLLSQARADKNGRLSLGILTLPQPDVRVTISGGYAVPPGEMPTELMVISVENHSPLTIYLSKIVIRLDNDEDLFIKRDFLTGELNTRRELNPGQRSDFHIGPSQLWKFRDRSFKCAIAVDEIHRKFQSNGDGIQRLVETLVKNWNAPGNDQSN